MALMRLMRMGARLELGLAALLALSTPLAAQEETAPDSTAAPAAAATSSAPFAKPTKTASRYRVG